MDKKARGVFVKKGIKAAPLESIEKPAVNADLRDATTGQLARALTKKIDAIPFVEIQQLRANPDDAKRCCGRRANEPQQIVDRNRPRH